MDFRELWMSSPFTVQVSFYASQLYIEQFKIKDDKATGQLQGDGATAQCTSRSHFSSIRNECGRKMVNLINENEF